MKTLITGMGRSGSKWLSMLLNCDHETYSEGGLMFSRMRSGYYEDNVASLEFDLNELCKNIDTFTIDSRLRLFISHLKDRMNVHALIRNPYKVIESMYKCSAFNRIPNLSRFVKDWNEYSDVKKLCYVVGDTFTNIHKNNLLVYRFEHILHDYTYVQTMCDEIEIVSPLKSKWECLKEININSDNISVTFDWSMYYKEMKWFDMLYGDIVEELFSRSRN